MTPKKVLTIAAAACALAVTACSSSPEPEDTNNIPPAQTIEGSLAAEQINGLIAGNTGFGQEQRFQWRTHYASDGTMTGRIWGNFGQERDRGTWQTTGNQLCRQWSQKWGERKRACFELFKDGEEIKLINIDGNADSYEMMLVSGNKVE